jgi:hypothetical protein
MSTAAGAVACVERTGWAIKISGVVAHVRKQQKWSCSVEVLAASKGLESSTLAL